MNKGQKVALRHAANAIDGTRPGPEHARLGAGSPSYIRPYCDRLGRTYPTVYLARRVGYAPGSRWTAQTLVASHFGLTAAQAAKVDQVAASTHNLKQRAQRVARFLRRAATEPGYIGLNRQPTTGAVAATL